MWLNIKDQDSSEYKTSICSLKSPSRIERMYIKMSNSKSITSFQYKQELLAFDFCSSQLYGDISVGVSGIVSSSSLKREHNVICKVYLALLMLLTSTTEDSPIIENWFSLRISNNPDPLINCPCITNKHCSM